MLGAAIGIGAGGFRAVDADLVALGVAIGGDPIDGLDGLSALLSILTIDGAGFGAGVGAELDFLSCDAGEKESLFAASGNEQGGSCEKRECCAVFKLLSKFIVANTRTQKKTPSHIGWPGVFPVAS